MTGHRRHQQAARMAAPGFSLIEILVAISIGVALTTVTITALAHTRATAARSRSLVANAQTAENMLRTLSLHLETMHPACLFAASASKGPDGVRGSINDPTLDDTLSITWMATLPSRFEATMNMAEDYRADFAWCRLEWSRDPTTQRGRLRFARTSPRREMRDPSNTLDDTTANRGSIIEVNAQPRRDHRRDMNDNALTWMPNISAANLAVAEWMGDEQDLQSNLTTLHPDMYTVDRCVFRWIRRNGDIVTMSVDEGIVITNSAGLKQTRTGAYDNDALQIVDGGFNDGDDPTMAGRTAHISEERPLRMEVRLDLTDGYVLGSLGRSGSEVRGNYWISIPIDPVGSSYAQ